jgi:hypothetical protein
MGTSKGYQLPTSPQWGKVKTDVTKQSGKGSVTPGVAKELVRTYVRTSFGSSRGNGSGGSGGSQGSGSGGAAKSSKAAVSTGRKLASFATAVANRGVDEALQELGLGNWVGRQTQDVIAALDDYLTDAGATLDQVDVRGALDDLWEKLLGAAPGYEEVRMILEENLQATKIGVLLFNFFSNYLYRHFCRSFYEGIRTKHGASKTDGFLTSIKEFIASALENFTFGKDLTRINWAGREGKRISEQIFASTLKVFGE